MKGKPVNCSSVLKVPFVLNVSINVISFPFSAAIGVIFGYSPALRSARLNPITALYHE